MGCDINSFFDTDGTCSACPDNCATCSGAAGPCLTCHINYFLNPFTDLCEECPYDANTALGEFFQPDNTGVCYELCGKSDNWGYLPCDDGNTDEQDGCSPECQVEEGYVCT